MCNLCISDLNRNRQEFSLGAISQGVWGWKSPSGIQGDLGFEVPQKLKQFADIVYRFWLQKRSKLKILHHSLLYSWPVCFTVGELAKPHVWGLSPPSPCLAPPLKLDPNANLNWISDPNRSIILTLAKLCSVCCNLCRLANCAQRFHSVICGLSYLLLLVFCSTKFCCTTQRKNQLHLPE